MKITTKKDPEWPLLSKPAAPVTDITTQVGPELVREMFQLLGVAGGVGLAAPQVGISLRFFITGFAKLPVVINPEIVERSEQHTSAREGCLSFPRRETFVRRPVGIRVKFLTHHGEEVLRFLGNYEARVFLHEFDHLSGVTIFAP